MSKHVIELSAEQAAANRKEIIRLLQSTKRQGIDTVIQYLDDNDFFTGAAAEYQHDNMFGGLAYHSLLVYVEARKVWENESDEVRNEVTDESLVIACLLHDLCKVHQYPCVPGKRPRRAEFDGNYHGKQSVDILESIGFELTPEESLAIRWHMQGYTKKANLMEGETIADYKKYAKEYALVALTMIGDANAAHLSMDRPADLTSVEKLFESFDEVKKDKNMVEYKKLEGKSGIEAFTGKKYKGLLFDIDYFEGQAAEDIAALAEYIESHDVKVSIVTTEKKPVYTKWLKKAPIRVDHIVGGGDIKVGRFKFCKKPEGRPMQVGIAWMDYDAEDVLSVCTKDIDKEASENAGVDVIVNPSPRELTALLSDAPRQEPETADLNVPAPLTGIFGAVCGDIIGSSYEHRRTKDYNFELFTKKSRPSDDTILTMALAKWLMGDRSEKDLKHQLISFANRYPTAYWGSGFKTWLASRDHARREASSNGSAMRVSPVGYAATSLEECLALAKQTAELTHNTPEGIHGAQAIAASIFLVRQGKSKTEVKAYIEKTFGYNLDQTIDEIRATYNLKEKFSLACNKCAAEAIICWLISDTYEQTVRNAVSLGGDADTIAAMAGPIAAATPGMEIPQEIAEKCFALVPDDLKKVLVKWEKL